MAISKIQAWFHQGCDELRDTVMPSRPRSRSQSRRSSVSRGGHMSRNESTSRTPSARSRGSTIVSRSNATFGQEVPRTTTVYGALASTMADAPVRSDSLSSTTRISRIFSLKGPARPGAFQSKTEFSISDGFFIPRIPPLNINHSREGPKATSRSRPASRQSSVPIYHNTTEVEQDFEDSLPTAVPCRSTSSHLSTPMQQLFPFGPPGPGDPPYDPEATAYLEVSFTALDQSYNITLPLKPSSRRSLSGQTNLDTLSPSGKSLIARAKLQSQIERNNRWIFDNRLVLKELDVVEAEPVSQRSHVPRQFFTNSEPVKHASDTELRQEAKRQGRWSERPIQHVRVKSRDGESKSVEYWSENYAKDVVVKQLWIVGGNYEGGLVRERRRRNESRGRGRSRSRSRAGSAVGSRAESRSRARDEGGTNGGGRGRANTVSGDGSMPSWI